MVLPLFGLPAALALLSAPAASEPRVEPATYRIAFSGARRREVHVDATVHPTSDLLLMSPVGASHLEGRWAGFVEDLVARDARGREVRLARQQDARWRILGRVPDELHLAWRVRLDHDLEPWPFGWTEASYQEDDCLYVATDALFLAPPDLGAAEVTFDVPAGWTISAPWAERAGEPWTFCCEGFEELTRAVLLVGEHREVRVDAVGADWILALGAELEGEMVLLIDALERLAPEAVAIFGTVPAPRFLVIANRAQVTEGSAHVGGMSLLLGERPKEGEGNWSYLLAHELVHQWIGITARRASSEAEWFNEGVTDYIAVLLLARSGLASSEQVMARIAASAEMALRDPEPMSLADAGRDKLAHYDRIYGGGFHFGLQLDAALRRASGGERSIEDLVRRLVADCGDGASGYDVDDLARLANEVAGASVRGLFQAHVRGERRLPIEGTLARLGLAAEVEGRGRRVRVRVTRWEGASPRQVALRRAIFAID